MIKYFPRIYKDELLSSYFGRLYIYSPYSSSIKFTEQVFERANAYIDYCFYNVYNWETKKKLDTQFGINNLIENHTLVKYYCLFQSNVEKRRTLQKAIDLGLFITQSINYPVSHNKTFYLRYCPLCMKEHKEIYFEVLPQIRELEYCPFHCCRYKSTNIPVGKNYDNTFSQFSKVRVETDNIEFIDEGNINVRFSRYVYEVLNNEIAFDNEEIGKYLTSKLEGTKYLSVRGGQRNVELLFNDIKVSFTILYNFDLSKRRISLILRDKEKNVFDTLLIAFFLNIKPYELTRRQVKKMLQKDLFDKKVFEMYKKGCSISNISKKLGCNKEVVRGVILGRYRFVQTQ